MERPSSAPTYAQLDDRLTYYKTQLKIEPVVAPTDTFSFREAFQHIQVTYTLTDDLDLTLLREVLELYGLLLFLHRETTSDVLYTDHRLRLSACPRDEVRPRMYVRLNIPRYDNRGEEIVRAGSVERAVAIWNALVGMFDYETPQSRLSDHYYETRRVMLELFGVDEAFAAPAHGNVTLNFTWAPEVNHLVETIPHSTLRRLELVKPSTPVHAENRSRTRLFFQGVHTTTTIDTNEFFESGAMSPPPSWIVIPGPIKSLTLVLSGLTTPEQCDALTRLFNEGALANLEIRVHTACGLLNAMAICSHLRTVMDAVIKVKMAEEWGVASPAHALREVSGIHLRSVQIDVTETPSMQAFVDTMMPLIEGESVATQRVLENCGELHLLVRVNEPAVNDFSQLGRLLSKIGHHVRLLTISSWASSDFFNEETYTNDPDAFQLAPIITACPNLRILNSQGGLFEDLPRLYEQGRTKLQTLQVQWATVASVAALAKTLIDPRSQTALYLHEFGTRLATDVAYAVFGRALESNTKFRYLRLGRRMPIDELARQLGAHNMKALAVGGSDFVKLLDAHVATGNARAIFAHECMDDDVLETIAEYVGPRVYRQIHMR